MSSSIHIGKVSSGSFLHNDRTQKVSYLIDDSSLNECSRSSSECIQEYQSLKLQASENYTKLTNQKMQKSTIFLKEAIVNLEEHHKLKDLEPIKERLESYGFKVLQMSIHRDEGFVNPDNKKQKNYHAHITMFNLDIESGKSVKFGKDYRTELSKLQTFVAKTLQMERGKVSVQEHADELKVTVSKASKRLDTHDYKKAMKIKEEAQQLLQKQGLLKDITIAKGAYDFREMQKKITALENANAEQKKELHSLNSQVKNTPELEIKNDKIKELESKIQELTEHKKALTSTVIEALKPEQLEQLKTLEPLTSFKKSKEFVKENILGFKNNANKALERTKSLQEENETLKERLSVLKQDMSVLQASNDELALTVGKKDKTIAAHKNNDEKLLKSLKIEPVQGISTQQLVYEEFKKLEHKNKTLSDTVQAFKTAFNELHQSLPLAVREKVVKFQEVVSAIKQQLSSPKQQEKKIYMQLGDEPVQKPKTKAEELQASVQQARENLQKLQEMKSKSNSPEDIRAILQKMDRDSKEQKVQNRDYGYSR